MNKILITIVSLLIVSFGMNAQDIPESNSWKTVLPEFSAEEIQMLKTMAPEFNRMITELEQAVPLPLNDMSTLHSLSDNGIGLNLNLQFEGPMSFFTLTAEDFMNGTSSGKKISRSETVGRILFTITSENEEEEFMIPLIMQQLAVGKTVNFNVYGQMDNGEPLHLIATLYPSGEIKEILYFDEALPDDDEYSLAVYEEKPVIIGTPPTPAPVREDRAAPLARDEIFTAVEQPSQFPGGENAMMRWLSENVIYPEAAQKNGAQGRVIVRFVVEKDGSISSPSIMKGVDKDLDREALRVVGMMPKWEPGKNNGKPVRSYYTLPITFKLQATETEEESR